MEEMLNAMDIIAIEMFKRGATQDEIMDEYNEMYFLGWPYINRRLDELFPDERIA